MSPKPKARPIKIHKIAMFPIDWGKSALEIFARVVPLVAADNVPADAAAVPADAPAVTTAPLPKETVSRDEDNGAGGSKDKPKTKEKKKRKTTSSEDDDNKGEKGLDNEKAGEKKQPEITLDARWPTVHLIRCFVLFFLNTPPTVLPRL